MIPPPPVAVLGKRGRAFISIPFVPRFVESGVLRAGPQAAGLAGAGESFADLGIERGGNRMSRGCRKKLERV